MNDDDFDDIDEDFDNVPVIVNRRKLTPEYKLTIQKMIRTAIRWQNAQVLFTCRDCCFYRPEVVGGLVNTNVGEDEGVEVMKSSPEACTLEPTNQLMLSKLMPTQLPECFLYDPLSSAFVGVLDLMLALGIDLGQKQGWASVVGRVAKLQDRYGYITGITQRNLNKYGS